ncbi:MAG: hypothetical protein K2M56_02385 [Muribaculaceae bacterium]|nr:hypothetical protein [Muribaculaceae bacterium]
MKRLTGAAKIIRTHPFPGNRGKAPIRIRVPKKLKPIHKFPGVDMVVVIDLHIMHRLTIVVV